MVHSKNTYIIGPKIPIQVFTISKLEKIYQSSFSVLVNVLALLQTKGLSHVAFY